MNPASNEHKPDGIPESSGPRQEKQKKRSSVKKFFFSDYIRPTDHEGRNAISTNPLSTSPLTPNPEPLKNVSVIPPTPSKPKTEFSLDEKSKKKGHAHRESHSKAKSKESSKEKERLKPVAPPPPAAAAPKPPIQPVLLKAKVPVVVQPVQAAESPPQAPLAPATKKGPAKNDESSTDESVSEEEAPKLTDAQITQQKIVALFDKNNGLEEICLFLNSKIGRMQPRFSMDYLPCFDAHTRGLVWKKISDSELQNHYRALAKIFRQVTDVYENGSAEFVLSKTLQFKNWKDLHKMLLENVKSSNTIQAAPKIAPQVASNWKRVLLLSAYSEAFLIKRIAGSIKIILEILRKETPNEEVQQKKMRVLDEYFELTLELYLVANSAYEGFAKSTLIADAELTHAIAKGMGKRQEEWDEAKQKLRANLIELIQRALEINKLRYLPQLADYSKMLEFQKQSPYGYHPLEVMIKTLEGALTAAQGIIPRLQSIDEISLTKRTSQRP